VELCIIFKEELLVMGEIVPLFLRLDLKKKKIPHSLEKMVCCGIKYWGISKRGAFDY
jgi:hypothetical protein